MATINGFYINLNHPFYGDFFQTAFIPNDEQL